MSIFEIDDANSSAHTVRLNLPVRLNLGKVTIMHRFMGSEHAIVYHPFETPGITRICFNLRLSGIDKRATVVLLGLRFYKLLQALHREGRHSSLKVISTEQLNHINEVLQADRFGMGDIDL